MTGDPEADEVLDTDPVAFFVGLMLDQHMRQRRQPAASLEICAALVALPVLGHRSYRAFRADASSASRLARGRDLLGMMLDRQVQ